MQQNLIPLTLAEHQQVLYEILYMVDDFCKAHDIPYFLVGGTLLGAVRHKGIIPWDDDVDIAMTRENYERFIREFHAEGVNGYELYDYEHKTEYMLPFAKMTKIDTFISSIEINRIFIDIFAYDGVGDNLNNAQVFFKKRRTQIQKFCDRFVSPLPFNILYDCWKAKCVWLVHEFPRELLIRIMLLVPCWRMFFLKKIIFYNQWYRIENSKYAACIDWGIYGTGEIQLSSSFLKLDEMRFGERELSVPSGWHEYLTGLYGDYMTPPPEEKRRRHISISYRVVDEK